MSIESFEEFFGAIKRNKSVDNTHEILTFMEKSVMQIAEIVDQLDLKVTALEGSLSEIKTQLQGIKNSPPSTARPSTATPSINGGSSIPPPPPGGGSGSAVPPPPPSGGSGLPPLPGMGSPPPPSGGGGFGGLSSPPKKSPPKSSPPPGDRPVSPMMMHANLQGELKDAFKKIRARLDKVEE